MKARRMKGLIIIMAICAAVFVAPIANAATTTPYNIGTLDSFLANTTYFNGYGSLIGSKDFSGTWQYTAIASEAGNVNVTKDPLSTSATTFTNGNTSNWGSWETVDFATGDIFFYDPTTNYGPYGVDNKAASVPYFKLYQLTADSKYLGYLGDPITLSSGTYILGFNDNGSTDADYDDFVIALRVVPQVPEPTSLLLLGIGLLGLVGARRKSAK